jgi:penicillin-binding protein 1A
MPENKPICGRDQHYWKWLNKDKNGTGKVMDIIAPMGAPAKKPRKRRSLIIRFLGLVFGVVMIVFVAGAGAAGFFLWKASADLPDYEVLARYEPPMMTRIHADNGSLIAEFSRERRVYVPLSAVPPRVIQAFLSAEDKSFYQHGGLDIQGIVRAIVTNLGSSGDHKVGASTITQQVAKNFLLSSDQTMERKLKEVLLSVRIERAFTKDQILELYLNEIYLGAGAYGVAAAADTYWDKALNELTIADVAYLATLPKAPSNYDPFRHPERAIERRNWVIDRMADNGYITRDEAAAAKSQPLNVRKRTSGPKIYASEYYAEEVRRSIIDLFGEDKLYGGGLSVRTPLDPDMQRMARKALIDAFVAYDHRHGWRGVVKKIDIAGDWGKTLAAEKVWGDIDPWRLAVVLEVAGDKAVVGLRPTRDAKGQLVAERETGIVPFSTMQWARPQLKRGMGGSPRSPKDVVKVGDVIYVSPREPKDDQDNVQGQWALQQVPAVRGALVAMDPHSGRVYAVVGGFSFGESQFDRAVQARRQVGSTLKPLIYATAIDNGYTPSSIIVDGPVCLDQGKGMPKWCPKNYEAGSAAGPSTLRFGIEKSRNLMTVRLASEIGMPIIAEYSRRFGAYDNLLPSYAMALGAGETTLLRMVAAYSTIANGGKQVTPTFIDRIQDRYGRTLWRHDKRDCKGCDVREWTKQDEPELQDVRLQVLDPLTSYQMTSIMEGVVQRGTAQKLKVLNRPLAGKTGTTNDEKDGWFIGFTPDLAVGAYLGFDQPKPMGHGETGGNVAAPAVRDFIKMALADQPAVPFRQPPEIKLVRINLKSGQPTSPGDPRGFMEAYKPNEGPAAEATASVSPEGENVDMGNADPGSVDTQPTAAVPPGPVPGPSPAKPKGQPVASSNGATKPKPKPGAAPAASAPAPAQRNCGPFSGIFGC